MSKSTISTFQLFSMFPDAKTALTDREVWEMRQLNGYVSVPELMKAYGISSAHLNKIINRRVRL